MYGCIDEYKFLNDNLVNRKYIILELPLRLCLEDTHVRKIPNKFGFILYFSQFALPLQRNDRVYPIVTTAAMAEEHVCLCTDFLQQ